MNLEATIIAYFEGSLDELEREVLLAKVKTEDEAQTLFEAYRRLYEDLAEEPLRFPKEAFAVKAKAHLLHLENERSDQSRIRPIQLFKYAAAIVLLVSFGLLIGLNVAKNNQLTYLSDELLLVKMEMKTLLQNKSTAQRIRAVKLSNEFQEVDLEVLNALIQAMNTDESENVRIAAIDALESFSQEAVVKKAFIQALKNSKDDLIKIKLIQVLAHQKNRQVLPLLEEILRDKTASKYLKSAATEGKDAVINL
ncbi:MAG: HEAT repeat domain-containing protein [Bacteroidota bacterium]